MTTVSDSSFSGKLDLCKRYSEICEFKCCDQDGKSNAIQCPANCLLIYPGELDSVDVKFCKHIDVLCADYNFGKLGCCNGDYSFKSKCDIKNNYKTLDCRSYPFAPAVVNSKLVLLADSRCPIILEKNLNKEYLNALYAAVIAEWKYVIESNKKIIYWIKMLDLPTYSLYEK